MIRVNTLVNDINRSNCFVIINEDTQSCILIDPASLDTDNIVKSIHRDNLKIDYIILTHSHFDHMASVSKIINSCSAKIVSSEFCSKKIIDPIKNLSYFSDIGPISSPEADIYIENLPGGTLDWEGWPVSFYYTPGHSLCSICIKIDNMLFVGDTLIKGSKTKITHPDGSRDQLKQSISSIYDKMPKDILILPGHGESFVLGTQDISVSMKN